MLNLKLINYLSDIINKNKGEIMFYGTLILLCSMILAVIIRVIPCKRSCILKKLLPYIVLFIGGIFATYIVIVTK